MDTLKFTLLFVKHLDCYRGVSTFFKDTVKDKELGVVIAIIVDLLKYKKLIER